MVEGVGAHQRLAAVVAKVQKRRRALLMALLLPGGACGGAPSRAAGAPSLDATITTPPARPPVPLATRSESSPGPVRIALSGPAHDVDVSEDVTCAALASSVACWGRWPELVVPGAGERDRPPSRRPSAPRTVFDGRVEEVRVRGNTILLRGAPTTRLTMDPSTGAPSTTARPEQLPALDDAVSIDFIGTHLHAVLADGSMLRSRFGLKLEPVPGITSARALAASHPRTTPTGYVLLADGTVVALDARGEVKPSPLAIRARSIAAPYDGTHLCAIVDATGEVQCAEDPGRRGTVTSFTSSLRGARSIAHADSVAVLCAVLADATVRCGWHFERPDAKPSPIVQDLSSLGGVREVDVGWSHACALTEDGSVHCWGSSADER